MCKDVRWIIGRRRALRKRYPVIQAIAGRKEGSMAGLKALGEMELGIEEGGDETSWSC